MTSADPNIETPCIGTCRLDPSGRLCIGCGRTVAEIAGWLAFPPDERRRLMTLLPARLAGLPAGRTPA